MNCKGRLLIVLSEYGFRGEGPIGLTGDRKVEVMETGLRPYDW